MPAKFPEWQKPGGHKYTVVPVTCRTDPNGRPEVIGYMLHPPGPFDGGPIHLDTRGLCNDLMISVSSEVLDQARAAEEQARKDEVSRSVTYKYTVQAVVTVTGHPWVDDAEIRNALAKLPRHIDVPIGEGTCTLDVVPATLKAGAK